MTTKMQPPRGTYDALPSLAARFNLIENTARAVFSRYGYGEIRTPMFEFADVFLRTVGDTTDIVTKEMYVFEDRGGERMALRPEGTAAVVRSYYSNGLKQDLPLKLFYVGAPMFRYERPQKGRYRQFHQVGAEFFGVSSPYADVEIIAMAVNFLKEVGLEQDVVVRLNSLGDAEDRKVYREILTEYLTNYKDRLSEESKERLGKNPLRVLDSKEKEDQEIVADAPRPIDHLRPSSEAHLESVKRGLSDLGIAYEIDSSLVRGLDYYTHTVFEVHGMGLGSQSQVIGGGRFDKLIEQMGGESVPAVGFGMGMERLEAILERQVPVERPVACLAMGEEAFPAVFNLAQELRQSGMNVHMALEGSFKSQMKKASKVKAQYAVIAGENEVNKGIFQLKNMDTSEQLEMAGPALIRYLNGGVKPE